MKKILFILSLLAFVLPSNAVLKEENISSTLSILRQELTTYHTELEHQTGFMKDEQQRIRTEMVSIFNRSNQNSLMLYSQKDGYIFDLTYACHEATEQYRAFQHTVTPFRSFVDRAQVEISRYDSLVNVLSSMSTESLTERGKIDRNVCLTLAVNIRRTLQENIDQQKDYIQYYKLTEQHLKSMNDYAIKRYNDIQTSIFSNGGDNYFSILGHLSRSIREAYNSAEEKYKPLDKVHSQWDSRLMFGLLIMIIFWGIISTFLMVVLIRIFFTQLIKNKKMEMYYCRIFKKNNAAALRESFLEKRTCIIWTATVVTFAAILGAVRLLFNQDFVIMACQLLVEYAWLLGVILVSLLIRLNGNQIKSGFRIYSPLMIVGFIVISFRIILIPNDLVNFIFPPVLLFCTLWQLSVIRRRGKSVPKSDAFYTNITLLVFIVSVISSWIGYTLLSVQILIWWIMQLTCILTITCISGLLQAYADQHNYKDALITRTWLYRLIHSVALPMMGVASIILSIYWAADVFNLSDTTWRVYTMPFLDSKNIRISIFGICQAIVLYFLFSYINKTLKAFMKLHFEKKDPSSAASKIVMSKNVLQVIVWGIWLIMVLAIFHVNNTWLIVVSGGLSTGIGFAMKDILENIYYGISLMMGRIKVGDLIECDGIRGKVSYISYTSTQMDTIDGCIITFQNAQLFSKNYKNLTKNHGYELAIIPVGVAYGSNINMVKELIITTVTRLSCREKKREVKVVFTEFGDNSINLKVLVWVPVLTHTYAVSEIMETIYSILMENNIEIPFPQRDLHIINSTSVKHEESEGETIQEIQNEK
ncbi:MAG: mechanosensitive ion channel [Prevotella sp.]|jgi:potassium efflux system protein|nr:mechanosensitive ion channel [Prevotella sp.]MCI1281507.1 mechanosensitive ion channel [Prevotella sp.]